MILYGLVCESDEQKYWLTLCLSTQTVVSNVRSWHFAAIHSGSFKTLSEGQKIELIIENWQKGPSGGSFSLFNA